MKNKRIKDVFTTYKIFNELAVLFGEALPWSEDDYITAELLDIDYLGHSGLKIISPLVEYNTSDEVTEDEVKTLAKVIYQRFHQKWEKLWYTVTVEYTPINNYDMIETFQDAKTDAAIESSTGSVTYGNTTSNNYTDTKKVWGFDSASGKNAEENSRTGSVGQTGSDSNTASVTKNNTINDSHTLKRSGNIGVTTTQQMLQSERDMWIWNYIESIYNDIDDILTISIY